MTHDMPAYVPLAIAERGALLESVHYGAVAVVDTEGTLIAKVGDIEAPVFSRSTCKPFQALALIAHPEFTRLGWHSQEIAATCGSHSGEGLHVELVGRMLASIDASEADLACGVHIPYRFDALHLRPAADEAFSPLEHNCSGKHAGMLALARLLNSPRSDYLDVGHPVQLAIREAVAEWTGLSPSDLGIGIDGCSAPNFSLPLRSLAGAYAKLVGSSHNAGLAIAGRRLRDAILQHPELISGTARFDLRLTHAGKGAWLSKIGAEGIHCLGVLEPGWGVAIKIADGGERAVRVVAIEVLRQLQLLTQSAAEELHDLTQASIINCRGREVGFVRPVLRLQR